MILLVVTDIIVMESIKQHLAKKDAEEWSLGRKQLEPSRELLEKVMAVADAKAVLPAETRPSPTGISKAKRGGETVRKVAEGDLTSIRRREQVETQNQFADIKLRTE